MEEFNADYDHMIRNADLRQARVDFLTGSLMIKIKCSFSGFNVAYRNRNQGRGLMPTVWQMMESINLLNTPDYVEKRAVFLLILQQGMDGGQLPSVSSGIMYETVKTVMCMGMEFWATDLEFDAEGIRFMNLQNVGDRILENEKIGL